MGLANTTNLVATLPGYRRHHQPRRSAELTASLSRRRQRISRNFSLTVEQGLRCNRDTDALARRTAPVTSAPFLRHVAPGTSSASVLFSQFFDARDTPVLPASWTSSATGGSCRLGGVGNDTAAHPMRRSSRARQSLVNSELQIPVFRGRR